RHCGKPLAVVLEDPLTYFLPITVREEHMMAFRRPVDAGIPLSLIGHIFPPVSTRATVTPADPCTGARNARHRSGANSPRGIDHGQSAGAHVLSRWSRPRGALGCSRRIGSVPKSYADQAPGRRSRSVSLRFTPRDLRPTFQEPHPKGTGSEGAQLR